MRSYLDILNELMEAVESDVMPDEDKQRIKEKLQNLLDLLWQYSY